MTTLAQNKFFRETERLTLRRPEPRDLEPFVAFCARARSKWVGGPADSVDAWEGFAINLGHWEILGYGYFHAQLKDSGEAVDRIGLQKPGGKPETELVYSLYEDRFEGLGLAQEGASACRDWVFGPLNLPTLVSYINPKNIRSIALAERMGALRDAKAERWPSHGHLQVWRHPKHEPVQ